MVKNGAPTVNSHVTCYLHKVTVLDFPGPSFISGICPGPGINSVLEWIFCSLLLEIVGNLLHMAALSNRAGHIYFHPVVSSFFLFLFPRLISAVGDWVSTTWCG